MNLPFLLPGTGILWSHRFSDETLVAWVVEDGAGVNVDGIAESLKWTGGALPPRLVFETLRSIHAVLFHFDDDRSSRILERLITKGGFDEDMAQPEGYAAFDSDASATDDLRYQYWGRRLADLHEFVLSRPPRNKLERWIKWQTSESNAFIVALAALLISVAVGILSLGLGAVQSWLVWKAWKEPVSSDDAEVIAVLQELVELVRQQGER